MFSKLLVSALCLFLISGMLSVYAAEKPVSPTDGFLNEIIDNDVDANGDRNDPDAVYVLERGGTYYVNAELRNVGWKLSIKAADGDGALPLIIRYPNTSGILPENNIHSYGDLSLKNLLLDGYDLDTETAARYVVWDENEGDQVVIDGCIIINARQANMRVSGGAALLKVTNTIVGNMGNIASDDPGNGRVVDFRDSAIESVFFQNCSFVSNYDRLFRHRGGSGVINNMEIDHCTIVDNMAMHGMIELGNFGTKFKFTNNAIVNPFLLGNDSEAAQRLTEFDASGETDANGIPIMFWISSIPNDQSEFEISNNYYYYEDAATTFLANAGIPKADMLTGHIKGKISNAETAFVEDTLPLVSRPDFSVMLDLLNWFVSPDGANKSKQTTTEHDFDRKPREFWTGEIDLSYGTSAAAYTGAQKGYPAGDLNWYPDKLTEWITAVREINRDDAKPETFALQQNYPNPFNPTTTINYSVSKAQNVTLTIYNTVGQEVNTLVNQNQNPGSYSVTWNGRDFHSKQVMSGVYFYQLRVGSEVVQTRKMLLVK
jgi:hypothetical protein